MNHLYNLLIESYSDKKKFQKFFEWFSIKLDYIPVWEALKYDIPYRLISQ